MNYGMPYYQQNNYPQFNPMQQMQQPQLMQAMPDDRIFVQGEVGAKAYIVASGNTVTLWDSENPVIYRKSVNPQGVPVMQKLTYSYDEETETSAFDKRLKGIEDRLARLEAPKEEVSDE